MPVLKCLNAGCQWQSQDLDAAFADALTKQLKMYNQEVHAPAAAAAAAYDLIMIQLIFSWLEHLYTHEQQYSTWGREK